MRRLLLAGATFSALGLLNTAARAELIDYTGNVVDYSIPSTGDYQIQAYGAQGGSLSVNPSGPGGPGGLGAEIEGDFNLHAHDVLQIAVGGSGVSGNTLNGGGGGGGGSFVVFDNMPLVIAGGGGGAGNSGVFPFDAIGGPGLTGPNGDGFGGNSGDFVSGPFGPRCAGGSGGGGFYGNGVGSTANGARMGTGGGGWPTLTGGNPGGGFGGGGGGYGGGGGGYSGGNGGFTSGVACQYGTDGGEGGGSFDAGADQTLLSGVRSGDGEVVINRIDGPVNVPEPMSIALFGIGLVGLTAARRARWSR